LGSGFWLTFGEAAMLRQNREAVVRLKRNNRGAKTEQLAVSAKVRCSVGDFSCFSSPKVSQNPNNSETRRHLNSKATRQERVPIFAPTKAAIAEVLGDLRDLIIKGQLGAQARRSRNSIIWIEPFRNVQVCHQRLVLDFGS
jgi:hypothetical protein